MDERQGPRHRADEDESDETGGTGGLTESERAEEELVAPEENETWLPQPEPTEGEAPLP